MAHAPAAQLQSADGPPTGRQVVIVLLASGAIGFLFGALRSTWQDALEPAQVLAGVRYQPKDPCRWLSVDSYGFFVEFDDF